MVRSRGSNGIPVGVFIKPHSQAHTRTNTHIHTRYIPLKSPWSAWLQSLVANATALSETLVWFPGSISSHGPHSNTHTPSFLRTFTLSLRKVAIAVHLSQSGEKGPPVLFFFPPKFHPHVIIRIKKEYSAYINGRPLSLYPLWTHRSSSSAVSCDMRYTDQCNGISGSLAAHLPFSFYPVSMSQETSLNRSSLEADASQERLP